MDETAIENKADDAMEYLDEAIEDWSIKDAITFMEYVESNVGFRLRALRDDLARS